MDSLQTPVSGFISIADLRHRTERAHPFTRAQRREVSAFFDLLAQRHPGGRLRPDALAKFCDACQAVYARLEPGQRSPTGTSTEVLGLVIDSMLEALNAPELVVAPAPPPKLQTPQPTSVQGIVRPSRRMPLRPGKGDFSGTNTPAPPGAVSLNDLDTHWSISRYFPGLKPLIKREVGLHKGEWQQVTAKDLPPIPDGTTLTIGYFLTSNFSRPFLVMEGECFATHFQPTLEHAKRLDSRSRQQESLPKMVRAPQKFFSLSAQVNSKMLPEIKAAIVAAYEALPENTPHHADGSVDLSVDNRRLRVFMRQYASGTSVYVHDDNRQTIQAMRLDALDARARATRPAPEVARQSIAPKGRLEKPKDAKKPPAPPADKFYAIAVFTPNSSAPWMPGVREAILAASDDAKHPPETLDDGSLRLHVGGVVMRVKIKPHIENGLVKFHAITVHDEPENLKALDTFLKSSRNAYFGAQPGIIFTEQESSELLRPIAHRVYTAAARDSAAVGDAHPLVEHETLADPQRLRGGHGFEIG